MQVRHLRAIAEDLRHVRRPENQVERVDPSRLNPVGDLALRPEEAHFRNVTVAHRFEVLHVVVEVPGHVGIPTSGFADSSDEPLVVDRPTRHAVQDEHVVTDLQRHDADVQLRSAPEPRLPRKPA